MKQKLPGLTPQTQSSKEGGDRGQKVTDQSPSSFIHKHDVLLPVEVQQSHLLTLWVGSFTTHDMSITITLYNESWTFLFIC